jgi:hypothetical protein
MSNTSRHGWLPAALSDRGFMQKDVAKKWGCDDAVVSRFIKTGTPELTFDRAQTLASMLDMTLDELRLRLEEGIAPRSARSKQRTQQAAPAAAPADTGNALDDLKAAAARARKAFPNWKIEVIVKDGSE